MSHLLYGADISYYTGKVRAYLRWKSVPYVEVPATAQVYRDVIVPRVGFPVIPVVVTPEGRTLQDSTEIIEALEATHGEPLVTPATPLQRLVASLFELYGDEWLVIPAMHYRWHHNREWAMRAFGQLIAPDATPEQQFEIGAKRAGPFAQAAINLGASTPEMQAAIERSYEALLHELDAHFSQLPYLLGTRPSIGDFSLFGPLYAHQYRDPASGELMCRLAPNVVDWVKRMEQPLHPRYGEFLADDQIPNTLLPVLQRMMREQLPVLADAARLLKTRIADRPDERIPRAIGTHVFAIEGVQGERMVGTYSQWMLQRSRDVYRAMAENAKRRADELLAQIEGDAFRDFEDPPRLKRDGLSVALSAG